MRVLIVCSYNAGRITPYIQQQVESVRNYGIIPEYFLIEKKGFHGYLQYVPGFIRKIKKFNPDLIHAHYGLSGLLANLQRKVPVITTFHGSDINNPKVRQLSKIAMVLSAHPVFVSSNLANLASAKNNYTILSCGIDLNTFFPMDKTEARKRSGFDVRDKIVLFAGSFSNKVKNYPLAKQAVKHLDQSIILLELKGYTQSEVNLLLNACDAALLTSFSEGSPNFIKEAMACNCPIVATDVGDIKEITGGIPGTCICNFSAREISEKLAGVLSSDARTNGREKILHLDMDLTARKLIEIYEKFRLKNN